jgi:hypothetical protein
MGNIVRLTEGDLINILIGGDIRIPSSPDSLRSMESHPLFF